MILKLKRTPAIYLVGFMGCGKSTVGRALAEELGWKFFDLDEEIEKQAGMTIPEVFEKQGEPAFRSMETQALRKRVQNAIMGRPQVISLGGGAFTIAENYDLAENHGITIWLDTPFEVAARRVAAEGNRPLAKDPARFRDLYESRREAYARADYRVESGDEPPEVIVRRILELPIFVP
jgi:shikimate kinase